MIDIDPSMFELFREEVRTHADTLSRVLLDIEADPANLSLIEQLMRAAHSIKGASRIIGIEFGVRLAHVMEDALVAAQDGKIRLSVADVDLLLQGSDLLASLAELTPQTIATWETANGDAVVRLEPAFQAIASGKRTAQPLTPASSDLKTQESIVQTGSSLYKVPLRQSALTPNPSPRGRGEPDLLPSPGERGWGGGLWEHC